jgi:hypothetical protein
LCTGGYGKNVEIDFFHFSFVTLVFEPIMSVQRSAQAEQLVEMNP